MKLANLFVWMDLPMKQVQDILRHPSIPRHPSISVEKNIKRFKKQLESFGFNYDWSREINTTDPGYYRWTQWIFLQLYKKGLAYQSFEPINWCPSCQTGLANEDLENGRCERCGSIVEKRPMRQWVLKITQYADRMLADLGTLNWPEHIKESQRNWIGRSEGATISFNILTRPSGTLSLDKERDGEKIEVFTTRADTLFGVTYVVLAPEHELVQKLKPQIKNWSEVEKYVQASKNKTEIERTAEKKDPSTGSGQAKTGVELKGVKVVNPANKEEVPVFVADYVLANYGTGAVMAVPAHDSRDWHFAKKFGLPIKDVVKPKEYAVAEMKMKLAYEMPFVDYGVLINSEEFTNFSSEKAKRDIAERFGKITVTYKLRDWVFSRQRYWANRSLSSIVKNVGPYRFRRKIFR